MRRCLALLLVLVFNGLLGSLALADVKAKNVILMVADGAGFNAWRAADMYQGKLGKQVYDGPGWVRLACSTYPLTRATKPTGTTAQDPSLVYDPAKAWDATVPPKKESKAKEEALGPFAGYRFLKKTYTDSAAAATALATGLKTYDNAINWSNLDQPLTGRSVAEIAKRLGKSAGVITTVPWSHATPACLGGAHNVSRNHYAAIANEMLNARCLDVIMGAGNPDFDDNGRPLPVADDAKPAPKPKDYRYVGGAATWKQLKSGQHPAGWTLVETKAAVEALAAGPTPRKLLVTAQVATTLQENRGKPRAAPRVPTPKPFSCPLNGNVPALATMTRAALNCLDDNPHGFYLLIEGGAVDWANHANLPERMIEEQTDFLQAVEAVVRWVETHSNWDETLVILTADHETGLLWGPKSDRIPFDPIVDLGKGNLPGLKYNFGSHTNSLVPLCARGPGSRHFVKLARGADPTAAAKYGISGQYVENTDIFVVMKRSIEPDH